MAPKNKGGRPRVKIDWKQFDKLCEMQCTLVEIASVLRCSEDTIERAVKRKTQEKMGFAEYFGLKSARGKVALRRKQFQIAMGQAEVVVDGKTVVKEVKPDVGMNIWLGKQYLKQAEKREITGKEGGPIRKEISLKNLSIDELKYLKSITEKLEEPAGESGGDW